MLEVSGLVVRYGRIEVLKGISISVERSEAVAVVGPNGAGKSTTVKAIFGLATVASGEISFEGSDLTGRRPETVARAGLSLVPEGRRIFTRLTVRENLTLAMRRNVVSGAEAIERELERFPVLARYLDRPSGGLSGGEQQQLAIARALVTDPKLLVLDEPSLGVAPKVVDVIFEVLASLRAHGVSLLLVEQKAARAVAFADRAYVLRAGRVVHEGSDLRGDPRLVEAYLGD